MDTKQRIYAWLVLVSTLAALALLVGFFSLPVLHVNSTTIIDQAGLQRSRIERMTKDALLIANTLSPISYTQAVSELQVSLPLWEATERGLQVGDIALGLPVHVPSDVLLLVIQAQPDYNAIDTALRKILAGSASIANNDMLLIQTQIVLDHEAKYYYLIGQINTVWKQRIYTIQDQLYYLELTLIGVVICLVLIGFIGMMRWAGKIKT